MYLNLKTKIICEIIISILLFTCYFLLYLNTDTLVVMTFALGADATAFPKTINLATSVLCAILVINSIRLWLNYKNNNITAYMKTLVSSEREYYPVIRIFLYILTLLFYCITFHYIGFLISTPFVLLIVGFLLGLKRIYIAAVFAVLFTFLLDYACLHFLQILLPRGELF